MASNDQEVLKSVLTQRHAEIASGSTIHDYFELFCAEQILKNFDLTRIMREGVDLGETQGPPCGTNVVYTNV